MSKKNVTEILWTPKKWIIWRNVSITAKTVWAASGTLMTRKMTTVFSMRTAKPQVVATLVLLDQKIAPKDTVVCKDHILKVFFFKFFLCFTNFTGNEEEVTEAVTEAVREAVTEAGFREDNGR